MVVDKVLGGIGRGGNHRGGKGAYIIGKFGAYHLPGGLRTASRPRYGGTVGCHRAERQCRGLVAGRRWTRKRVGATVGRVLGGIKVHGKCATRCDEYRGVPIVHGNYIVVLRVFAHKTIHTPGTGHRVVAIAKLDVAAALIQLDLEIVDVACRVALHIAPFQREYTVGSRARHLVFQLTG